MGLRVLIVEDDQSMAELLKRFLGGVSDDIVNASSFDEALRIMRIIPPADIITLDLSLSIGGAEMTIPRINELREANEEAVIIVISGAVEPISQERIIAAGADYFMQKSDLFPQRKSGKGFIGALSDAIDALLRPPRDSKNVLILELLAERLAKTKNVVI